MDARAFIAVGKSKAALNPLHINMLLMLRCFWKPFTRGHF